MILVRYGHLGRRRLGKSVNRCLALSTRSTAASDDDFMKYYNEKKHQIYSRDFYDLFFICQSNNKGFDFSFTI